MAREKRKEEHEPVRRFVVDPNYKPSFDSITQAFFGMTVKELAQDIIRNPGGKYNGILYKNEEVKT